MKENKVRKIILGILSVVIVAGIVLHFSIKGPDIKSKISKQVSIGRELVNTADKGNDNGQYSEYAVKSFSEKVEAAAAVMADRKAAEDDSKKALEQIKSDIEDFKVAENENSISAADVQALMDEGGIKEHTEEVSEGLQAEWRIEGNNLDEAAPVNLDIKEDGVYTADLNQQVSDSYEAERVCNFSLRHDGKLPGKATLVLKGDFSQEENYLACRYDGEAKGIEELEVSLKNGFLELGVEQGGDYVILRGEEKELVNHGNTNTGTKGADSSEASEGTSGESDSEASESTSSQGETIEGSVPSGAQGEENTASGENPSSGGRTENTEGNTSGNQGGNSQTAPTQPAPTQPAPTQTATEPEEVTRTCIIEIRCDTVLNNMDQLTEGLEGYIPGNGVILSASEVELYEGETVFDVLKRTTRETGIKLEFRNDGVHGAGYIVGINHLNEFDCGEGSGWMYTVNGWFPNYGCAKYVLEDNDVIQWIYTCDLGRDIGGHYW
ncbi:DUF4430 domain-containing protein [Qiania dongpingensis]|uniref:DUF4430 domain-containing protein n=1 Tax=Qiania dongpingensis TaxID=2763669 RepID=A0A7G9G4I0_9FIRM|nr:DUF4430 domain-containing protein [Qiania dongpingensis]QNM05712.1 DUF4430 domain-containing protein [Qiania dongpingensis]